MESSSLTVDGVPVDSYLTRFVWDEAKYPTMSPLREIVDGIHTQVAKIEDDLKVPRSSKLLYEDNEYALYTAILFRPVADHFRSAAREKGFQLKRFLSFSVRQQIDSVENNMPSSCSWSTDKHGNPHQSLWLQTTLSEFDKKMKAMMTLFEEEGSSSVEREEIYNNRIPELIQRLGDFSRSYRSLAEQCAQLRSKSHHVLHSGSSSSSSSSYSTKIGCPSKSHPKLEAFDSQSESVVEDHDVECNHVNFQFEYLNRLADELMSTESCKIAMETETEIRGNVKYNETTEFPNKEKKTMNGSEIREATIEDLSMGSSEQKNTWHDLKFCVTKLMEESLRQQAELLKRNEDKRKIINGLRSQVERLKSENRVLQSGLRFPKGKAKSEKRVFSKFFKAGCS